MSALLYRHSKPWNFYLSRVVIEPITACVITQEVRRQGNLLRLDTVILEEGISYGSIPGPADRSLRWNESQQSIAQDGAITYLVGQISLHLSGASPDFHGQDLFPVQFQTPKPSFPYVLA